MASKAFMEVRDMLGGGTSANSNVIARNTTGVLRFSTAGDAGAVEVQKTVDSMIRDAFSRDTEFRQLVSREPMAPGNLVHTWLIEESLASNVNFYDEGDAKEPAATVRKQLFAPAKALRADYEVSGLLIAGGMFNVLDKEARNALTKMDLVEEQAMINGANAQVGITGSYDGLLQIMTENSANGVTGTIYGLVQGTDDAVDIQTVDGGTSGTATGVLDLSDLDSSITKLDKRMLGGRRIFLSSFERADEINQLLQPQQRFAGSIEIAAGFRVLTYRGIPIVRSKRMAFNGVTNTGSNDVSTDVDNSMYLLTMDDIAFKLVGGVDQTHVPINGVGDSTTATNAGGTSRADAVGGYFKTYGVFVVQRFDNQCLIWNLTVP